jgi:PPP family 3-phenylpropionic acid transporter
MHFIARAVPPEMTATAQSLNGAFAGGIAMGLALLLAGWLFDAFGAGAFNAMALLAAAALGVTVLLGRVWRGGHV